MTDVKSKKGVGLKWLMQQAKTSHDECIIWPFGKSARGYGSLVFEGRRTYAHRVMTIVAHGPPPSPKHDAAHSCGVRRCINPNHLRWASRHDNAMDRVDHGTHTRGSRSNLAKLTEAAVIDIYQSRAKPIDLARKYGVARHTIYQIRGGRSWGWLTEKLKRNPK